MRIRVSEQHQVTLLCVVTDLVLCWFSYQMAALFRFGTLQYVDFALLLRDRGLCVLLFAGFAFLLDVYNSERLNGRFDSVYYTLAAVCLAGVTELALVTLVSQEIRMISRREIVIGSGLSFVLLGIWRVLAPTVVGHFPSFHRHFVVLGSESDGRRIAQTITKELSGRGEAYYTSFDALQDGHENPRLAHAAAVGIPRDAIVVASEEDRRRLPEWKMSCERRFRRTFLYPGVYEVLLFEHRRLLAVAGVPVIQVAGREAETPYVHIKRALDILVAGLALAVLLPVCTVFGIAIKLTSPGGIFFTQERLGKDGRPFRICKFRTMTASVDARDERGRPVPAAKTDPRVSRVGKFMRKHRIDEIPQLWNVLRGDMSFVGPRPLWEGFFDRIDPEEQLLVERRLRVRPGLTSLSHVLGTYDSEHRDRLRYDALYINTLSFATDLRIILATIRIVLSGKGAQ